MTFSNALTSIFSLVNSKMVRLTFIVMLTCTFQTYGNQHSFVYMNDLPAEPITALAGTAIVQAASDEISGILEQFGGELRGLLDDAFNKSHILIDEIESKYQSNMNQLLEDVDLRAINSFVNLKKLIDEGIEDLKLIIEELQESLLQLEIALYDIVPRFKRHTRILYLSPEQIRTSDQKKVSLYGNNLDRNSKKVSLVLKMNSMKYRVPASDFLTHTANEISFVIPEEFFANGNDHFYLIIDYKRGKKTIVRQSLAIKPDLMVTFDLVMKPTAEYSLQQWFSFGDTDHSNNCKKKINGSKTFYLPEGWSSLKAKFTKKYTRAKSSINSSITCTGRGATVKYTLQGKTEWGVCKSSPKVSYQLKVLGEKFERKEMPNLLHSDTLRLGNSTKVYSYPEVKEIIRNINWEYSLKVKIIEGNAVKEAFELNRTNPAKLGVSVSINPRNGELTTDINWATIRRNL